MISNAGTVSNQAGYVGDYTGVGTVTVTGAGSTWINSAGLTIGSTGGGNASVEVKDGGTLNVGTTLSLAEPSGEPTAELKLRTGGTINTTSFSRGDGTLTFTGGTMNVSGGTFSNGLMPTTLYLEGDSLIAVPTLRLSNNASTSNIYSVVVGNNHKGALEILSGAEFHSSNVITLGSVYDSFGSILVDGTGSSLQSYDNLVIGSHGGGLLTISDGGSVVNNYGYIGELAGSTGNVYISGSDSTWSNSYDLYVGKWGGVGALTISEGGVVSNHGGFVGQDTGGTGSVNVTGTGSTWTNSDVLTIGSINGGNAWVEVKDGGTLNVDTLLSLVEPTGAPTAELKLRTGGTINTQSFSRGDGTLIFTGGTMIIDGGTFNYGTVLTPLVLNGDTPADLPTLRLKNNATTTNILSMTVGSSRQGAVEIFSGADMTITGNITLGNTTGSSGSLLVSGTGSTLQPSGNLTIGNSGSGSLTISEGGAVSNQNGYVGYSTGGAGTATVTGSGSTWTNAAGLTIGSANGGNTWVEVKDGGILNVDTLLSLVEPTGAPIAFLVLRTGGTIKTKSFSRGDGTLIFTGGLMIDDGSTFNYGTVLTPLVLNGDTPADLPTLRLINNAATKNIMNMTVGSSRQGAVEIFSGADMTITGNITLGNTTGSSGSLLVSGTGSTLQPSGNLTIGNSGSGSLTISEGGAVSNQNGYVGYSTGGAGTATVTGSGSTWTNAAGLTIGSANGGTAWVEVNDGGAINVTGTLQTVEPTGAPTCTLNIFNGGTVNATAGITNTAYMNMNNGAIIGGGTVLNNGGATFLAGGTIAQPLNNSGTLAIQGILAVGGTAAFSRGSLLQIDLGGTTPGTEYDQMNVTGSAALSGTLDVALIDPFVPSHNDQFTVLTFASHSGGFATYNGLNLGPRLNLVPQYTATSLILTAVQGGSGEWGVDQDGNASVPGNWIGAIPNGIGDVATFGPVITQKRTVTIDVATVYGGMVFNDGDRYMIDGSQTLELNNNSGPATIQVLNASSVGHIIHAPLNLQDELSIINTSVGLLFLNGSLDNSLGKQITVSGSGGVTLSGTQNHGPNSVLEILSSGPGLVNLDSDGGGNLSVDNDGLLNVRADNVLKEITGSGATTVATNQTLQTTRITQGSLIIAAGGKVIIAPPGGAATNTVPEPSAMLLLMLAALAGLAFYLTKGMAVGNPKC